MQQWVREMLRDGKIHRKESSWWFFLGNVQRIVQTFLELDLNKRKLKKGTQRYPLRTKKCWHVWDAVLTCVGGFGVCRGTVWPLLAEHTQPASTSTTSVCCRRPVLRSRYATSSCDTSCVHRKSPCSEQRHPCFSHDISWKEAGTRRKPDASPSNTFLVTRYGHRANRRTSLAAGTVNSGSTELRRWRRDARSFLRRCRVLGVEVVVDVVVQSSARRRLSSSAWRTPNSAPASAGSRYGKALATASISSTHRHQREAMLRWPPQPAEGFIKPHSPASATPLPCRRKVAAFRSGDHELGVLNLQRCKHSHTPKEKFSQSFNYLPQELPPKNNDNVTNFPR